MEPFGLLQFLQNLLTPAPTANEGASLPETPPSPANADAEKAYFYPVEEGAKANPAADFLENHRKRSERIKR